MTLMLVAPHATLSTPRAGTADTPPTLPHVKPFVNAKLDVAELHAITPRVMFDLLVPGKVFRTAPVSKHME
jgi:hypothetical protein